LDTLNGINVYNESPLHAALKAYIAQPGDLFEVAVDGYIIDIKRGDLLIEVQTSLFSAIKTKLFSLTTNHPVRLVYPIAQTRWIVRPATPDNSTSAIIRRKSPKDGSPFAIFTELVSFPQLIKNLNFTIEVLYTQEEEYRKWEGRKAWRRKGWVIEKRNLLEVVGSTRYTCPADFLALLPMELPEQFTTSDLAKACKCRIRLARQMAYCLREMGGIHQIGKRGRAYLYQVADCG
jgi:hypothetical protein